MAGMAAGAPVPVADEDVYALTARGSAELHAATTSLAEAELAVLVLIDGRSTVAQLVRSLGGVSRQALLDTLGKFVREGLIEPASKAHAEAIDAGDFFSITSPMKPPSGAEGEANPELAAGVKSLHDQGYYVQIARRAAKGRRLAPGEKLSVLVIEDEPQLAKLLQMYLKLEGFVPRAAADRAGIVAAFRQPAPPDLVLLDVLLPDANGFDVLSRMRQHPVLKSVPVILLTAKATREAVLKGLQCGANGYITKPFEIDVLMKAVKTVLGLEGRPRTPQGPGNPEEHSTP